MYVSVNYYITWYIFLIKVKTYTKGNNYPLSKRNTSIILVHNKQHLISKYHKLNLPFVQINFS